MNKGIQIAGGGLAGLSLGIGLRLRGVPVVLHEAGRYPRHRVCGEFISGVRESTLEALGIEAALADAERHTEVKWYRSGCLLLEGRLPEPALGVSRHRLDQRLKERLLETGGELREGERLQREAREGLVWAAGRVPTRSEWIGLKCHVRGLRLETGLEMHMGGNGYLGLTRVEGDRVNVCGLFRRDRARGGRGSELLLDYLRAGGHDRLAARIRSGQIDESSFLGVAGFQLGRQPVQPGLCALGDAEGMIPPFTGNGMSMAFEAAELALPLLEKWSRGACAWSAVLEGIRASLQRKFRRRVATAMALHRVLLHARGQDLIEGLSRYGLVPFRPMLSLVR